MGPGREVAIRGPQILLDRNGPLENGMREVRCTASPRWNGKSPPPEDKLATCADFVAQMWRNKRFVARVQNSIMSVEDMKPYAQELLKCLDAAFKPDPDSDRNRQMYTNQIGGDMAVLCMISMRWLETSPDQDDIAEKSKQRMNPAKSASSGQREKKHVSDEPITRDDSPPPSVGDYALRSVYTLSNEPGARFVEEATGKALAVGVGGAVGEWQVTEIEFSTKRVVLKNKGTGETRTLQLPQRKSP